jgi:hypothetical protein
VEAQEQEREQGREQEQGQGAGWWGSTCRARSKTQTPPGRTKSIWRRRAALQAAPCAIILRFGILYVWECRPGGDEGDVDVGDGCDGDPSEVEREGQEVDPPATG